MPSFRIETLKFINNPTWMFSNLRYVNNCFLCTGKTFSTDLSSRMISSLTKMSIRKFLPTLTLFYSLSIGISDSTSYPLDFNS